MSASPVRLDAADTAGAAGQHAAAEPLVVDAARLAVLLSCGVRTVRTWDAAGRLPKPLRIGGRVVWRVAEVHDWLAAGAPDREAWTSIRGK
jgi:predicted DNA-binding transcriptional regulator AlpA